MELVQDIWQKLFSVQPSPELWTVLLGLTIAIILTFTPLWSFSRNVITVVHEAGHAFMGILWGRRISGIKLHSDTSGVTVSSGKPYGLGMIFTTAAGYTAPAALGLLLSYMISTGRIYLALVILGVSALLVFLSIRNFWGLIVTIPLIAGLYYSLQFNETIQTLILVTLALFLSVASTRPIIELQKSRSRGIAEESDADQLQKLTLIIPGIIWVVFFMAFSLASNILAAMLFYNSLK